MSTKPSAGALAARALFTDGRGKRAQRLVFDYTGHMGGNGWCEEAVADQIDAHTHAKELREALEHILDDLPLAECAARALLARLDGESALNEKGRTT